MSTQFTVEPGAGHMPAWDRVVAGFDGSPGSAAAVEWAACEAAARGSSLWVVTCSAVPLSVGFSGAGGRQSATLTAVVEATQSRHGDLIIEQADADLDPRDALIDEAANADLLVVGSSEPGAAEALLRGSVGRNATRRSPCPVVVVRGLRPQPVRRIVVGVDGSSAAAAALDWAADEADCHGAELVVVHVWQRDLARVEAQCVVDLAVNHGLERTASVIRGELVEGVAAKALNEASRDADIIAIGSRGRSGFKTLLFGSVALSVAEQANCAVAVIHPQVNRT